MSNKTTGRSASVLFFLALLFSGFSGNAKPNVNGNTVTKSLHTFSFEENKGQLADEHGNLLQDISYFAISGDMNVYFRNNKLSFVFTKTEASKTAASNEKATDLNLPAPAKIEAARMDMEFIGANNQCQLIASQIQKSNNNYYLGHTGEKGITNAHSFNKLTYKNIYPQIDLILEIKDAGMEYSFLVHPGGNVNDIRIKWNGADDIKTLDGKGFRYSNALGFMEESAPICTADGQTINSKSILKDNCISFDVDKYNTSSDLLIDPVLIWATYYGGTKSDLCYSIKAADSGNVLITGYATSTSGIATKGAYQTSNAGTTDAYIAKFNTAGAMVWATYYGGGSDDQAKSITLDDSGNIYLTGLTFSTNSSLATKGAYQSSNAGNADVFLAKFTNSGKRIWSTFYGGSASEYGLSLAIGKAGNVYVSGLSTSSSAMGTSGTYQSSNNGGNDGYIAKFTNSGNLIWGTYIGGSNYDRAGGIALGDSDNIFITGLTSSTSNIATTGAFQKTIGSTYDAYIAKFDSTGNIFWASYMGGSSDDIAYGIAITDSDNFYITGNSSSSSGIATTGAYQTTLKGGGPNSFIEKFSTKGKRIWGTYYGLNNNGAYSAAMGDSGNIYIAGYYTNSTGYGLAFGAGFSKQGKFIWSTLLGDSGGQVANAICAGDSGSVYLGGNSSNNGMKATKGAYKKSNSGSDDIIVAKYIPGSPYFASAGRDTTICQGDSVQIGSASKSMHYYSWSSKPAGFTSTTSNPRISPAVSTTYYLMDSLAGFLPAYDTVKIKINSLPSAKVLNDTSLCMGDSIHIGAASVAGNSYSWTSNPSGFTSANSNAVAKPSSTTTYTLTETIKATGCTKTDSVKISVNPLPSASVHVNASICKGDSISIGASSVSGSTYSWIAKPAGFTSTNSNPSVSSATNTTYSLTETITATGCKKSDSVKITVNPLPAAMVGSSSTICSGDSALIGASSVSGNTYNWTSSPAGYSSAFSKNYVSPTVSTEYYLTETITATGCRKSDSVRISVNALPTALLTQTGDTLIASIGTSFFWYKNGILLSGISTAKYIPLASGKYYVNISNSSGCSANSNSITVTVLKTLSGKISQSGGAALKNSYVYLLKLNRADTSFAPVDSTLTDTSGKYSFTLGTDSILYVLATPDTSVYHNQVPTYYSTSYTFQDADSVYCSTNKTIINFSTLLGGNTGGAGFIRGKVVSCLLCKSTSGGKPVQRLRVLLINSSKEVVAYTYTNGQGIFEFSNIPVQKYEVYIDKPFVNNSVAPSLTLTNAISSLDSQNFILYPTYLALDVTTGIDEDKKADDMLNIFPNPFSDFTNIEYTLTASKHVKAEIFDVTGRELALILDEVQSSGKHTARIDNCGKNSTYILRIQIGNDVQYRRIIQMK